MKAKWLWHSPSNSMALADLSNGGLPLITLCEEDINFINPFYSYPLSFLTEYCGWVVIGEL